MEFFFSDQSTFLLYVQINKKMYEVESVPTTPREPWYKVGVYVSKCLARAT